MNATNALNAFRRADKADKSNVVRTALFQPVDRRDGGVRRCQHRRDHDHQPLVQIARRLEEVFHGGERFRFAVKADMRDPCGWHQIEHAFRKGHAGTQHRCEHQLLACDLRRLHMRKRRFDFDIGQRQVAGDLVTKQHPDLLEEFAKRLG